MKASKLIAAVVSGAAALALVGGIAYAMEPDHDPATLPMPEAAQDTSIVKQVASIIVYEDQEEAVAMASEFDDIHDELAMDAVSSRASLSAKHSASHDATGTRSNAPSTWPHDVQWLRPANTLSPLASRHARQFTKLPRQAPSTAATPRRNAACAGLKMPRGMVMR